MGFIGYDADSADISKYKLHENDFLIIRGTRNNRRQRRIPRHGHNGPQHTPTNLANQLGQLPGRTIQNNSDQTRMVRPPPLRQNRPNRHALGNKDPRGFDTAVTYHH